MLSFTYAHEAEEKDSDPGEENGENRSKVCQLQIWESQVSRIREAPGRRVDEGYDGKTLSLNKGEMSIEINPCFDLSFDDFDLI